MGIEAMNPVGAGIATAQAGLGVVQMVNGMMQTPKLLSQLRAFKTPDSATKILQAAQAGAGIGYDAFTLNYLTSGINKAAAASLGTAARLGADPNTMSEILDQRIQGIMKVGAENHNLNMQNFSRYLSALDMIAKNKESEWASQQNLVKDKLQAVNANKQAGLQNLGSAANAFISMDAARRTGSLYGATDPTGATGATGAGSGISVEEATQRALDNSTLINQ